MHGETAAVAIYARRAIKDNDSGKPLAPLAQKMNEMAQKYYDTSRPAYRALRLCRQDRGPEGAARLPQGVCRRLLPEPEVHLPAAPDAAAADHQGLRAGPGGARELAVFEHTAGL